MAANSWIAEALIQFVGSPVWRSPINDFTDDNCGVFSADEGEMSLEYTPLHKTFITLVDTLLTDFVQEMGVSLEDALDSVRTSLNSTSDPDAKLAMEKFMRYIFCVEDFNSFHKMMVKRNIELDILAARALQMKGVMVDMPAEPGHTAAFSAADEARAASANCNMDEEEALRAAIAASLTDQNMNHKTMELEDAELQEALALSVQAENDRARQSMEKVTNEIKSVKTTDLAEAEATLHVQLTAIQEQKEYNIQKLSKQTLEAREENVVRHLTAEPREPSREPSATKEKAPQLPPAAPAAAVLKQATPPAKAVAPAPAPVPAPALPPMKPAGGFAKALPPISQPPLKAIQADVEKKLPPLSAKPNTAPAPAAPTLTKEDFEARAKYMREQREKILAANKAHRQQELTDYAEKNKVSGAAATLSADKQLTIDIARRLREDIVGESRKQQQQQ